LELQTLSEPFRHPGEKQPWPPGAQTAQAAASAHGSARFPERRRHKRGRVAGPHAATVLINEKNAGLVSNLSEGGMRVQALGRRLEQGTSLRLKFQLPGSPEPIHTSGVVAWVSESAEAGIRFAELSGPLARRLREWLAKNEVLNAARDFLKIAGGWQAALELMAELTRILTDAPGVAITPALPAKPSFPSPVADVHPMRATVAAPIYKGERIIGHLEISSAELGAFDEQDLELLRVLAAIGSEMTELRAAKPPEPAQKLAPPPAKSATRGMFPTIRVRLLL
jgi:hypothetical protein